jgi:hypothetical protein
LPELVELERDRNKARSRRRPQPLRSKPVTIGDLVSQGKLLEVHCSSCRPARHLCGVGDFRQEKGASDHGQWVIAGAGTAEADQWQEIVESGGREAQDAAFLNPDMNDDTLELLQWFDAEIQRRGRQREIDAQAIGKRKRSKDAPVAPGNGATVDMEVQQDG